MVKCELRCVLPRRVSSVQTGAAKGGDATVHALDHVSLAVREREVVGEHLGY